MNDLKWIEELLEKYYRGETSTAEENSLREFFSGQEIPSHLEAEAGLFRHFSRERDITLAGEMEEKLARMTSGTEIRKIGGGIKLRYYWISAAAAVILILVGLFVDMQIRRNSMLEVRQDTFEDPYLAYEEAKKVLYLVSTKMNVGREPLRNINKLDKGVNYMHPVFSFGAGIQHLEHLNTIEKTRKLLSN